MLLLVARLSVAPESGNFGSVEAVEEHRAVIAAVESRNGMAAEEAVRGYIEQAKRRRISPREAELS